MPSSDGRRLSEMFGSRDPDKIIDALGEWNAKMAQRAMEAMDNEAPEKAALDPTVSTALNQVFANGTKLAKLINPALSGGPTVNVGIATGGRPQVSSQRVGGESGTRELAATVIAELEAEGYDRSKITEAMVKEKLQEYVKRDNDKTASKYGLKEIEAEVVEDDE